MQQTYMKKDFGYWHYYCSQKKKRDLQYEIGSSMKKFHHTEKTNLWILIISENIKVIHR